MVDIYLVDARKPGKSTPDSRIPFQRFYLIPGEIPLEKFRKLTPYSIIAPLTESYQGVLEERGVPFTELYEKGYRVMVPIHMSRVNDDVNELYPTYISNRPWWFRADQRLPEFFPEDVTLLTPEAIITPMCLSCDYHLEHMAGECVIGSRTCMDHVRIGYIPVPEKLLQLNVPCGV